MDIEYLEEEQTIEDKIETTEKNTMAQKPIGVYVKINSDGYVVDINSDIFINDFDGWLKIDEGFGDLFAHAQSQYFGAPLVNENGEYVIRL